MFSIDPDAVLIEANEKWFEITQHRRDPPFEKNSWLEPFDHQSREVCEEGWEALTVQRVPWTAELRMATTWYDANRGDEVDRWLLAAAAPEFTNGELKCIMGSVTDISFQKRSERDADTRAKLSEQLLLRTQEAKENEKNFKRFSDLAPGGLIIMDPHGNIEYANSQYVVCNMFVLAILTASDGIKYLGILKETCLQEHCLGKTLSSRMIRHTSHQSGKNLSRKRKR